MKKVLANIISRLQLRFNLRTTGDIEDLMMADTIQPVTDMDELLSARVLYLQGNAISGTGNITALTVPPGKRYKLLYWAYDRTSGTFTFTQHGVQIGANGFTLLTWAASSNERGVFTQPIELEQGDIVQVYIDSFTGAGNLNTRFLLIESNAF
jgi:hypothetical protein